MAGTLSRVDLIADHTASLGATIGKFDIAEDLDRHLDKAVLALSNIRRRTLVDVISLIAGQGDYAAPTDIVLPKISRWGQDALQPWQPGYSRLPRLKLFEDPTGLMINLNPAPTAQQIGLFGTKYSYFYLASHQINDDPNKTTFNAADRGLFLLLALIEAMIELAVNGVTEPVQLHRGMGSSPANGTPSALVELLGKQVDRIR